MRSIALALLLLWISACGATAEITKNQRKLLNTSLGILALEEDTEAAATFGEAVASDAITFAEWSTFFNRYFDKNPFTDGTTRFWEYAISAGGDARDRIAAVSGVCAAAALGEGLDKRRRDKPATYDSIVESLTWLHRCAVAIEGDDRVVVRDAFLKAIQGHGPGLAPSAGMPRVEDAGQIRLGIQLCLTSAEFAGGSKALREAVSAAMALREPGRSFWESTGAFLLDNGALGEEHVESLQAMAAEIPSSIHRVVLVAVPVGLALDPTGGGYLTSGQILSLVVAPMGRTTPQTEWQPGLPQPVAPLFTIHAAQLYVRAIQQEQLENRPELRIRLAGIINRAGNRQAAHVRRFIDPGLYQSSPDELLPAIGYLWFIDSENTVRQAVERHRLGEPTAMESVLLFADMISGGEDRAIAYTASESGAATEAAVGRVTVEVSKYPGLMDVLSPSAGLGPMPYANAIGLGEFSLDYTLNDDGHIASPTGPYEGK
jgi:hypothetical protein